MIGIRMRPDYQVYRAVIPRHHFGKSADDCRIRSAIYESLCAAWRFNIYRVALSNVEKRNSELPMPVFSKCCVPNESGYKYKYKDSGEEKRRTPRHRRILLKRSKRASHSRRASESSYFLLTDPVTVRGSTSDTQTFGWTCDCRLTKWYRRRTFFSSTSMVVPASDHKTILSF